MVLWCSCSNFGLRNKWCWHCGVRVADAALGPLLSQHGTAKTCSEERDRQVDDEGLKKTRCAPQPQLQRNQVSQRWPKNSWHWRLKWWIWSDQIGGSASLRCWMPWLKVEQHSNASWPRIQDDHPGGSGSEVDLQCQLRRLRVGLRGWHLDVGSAPEEDDTWKFTENGDGFSYIRDAPTFHEKEPPTGTLQKNATGEKFTLKLCFATKYLNPGETQLVSGCDACGNLQQPRKSPPWCLRMTCTLALTEMVTRARWRLEEAINFDVIYLGWSGWRGGNFKLWKEDDSGLAVSDKSFLQKAEYMWTTVAYVISQAGEKLLEVASPIHQPDNFMAWQATSWSMLKSFVASTPGAWTNRGPLWDSLTLEIPTVRWTWDPSIREQSTDISSGVKRWLPGIAWWCLMGHEKYRKRHALAIVSAFFVEQWMRQVVWISADHQCFAALQLCNENRMNVIIGAESLSFQMQTLHRQSVFCCDPLWLFLRIGRWKRTARRLQCQGECGIHAPSRILGSQTSTEISAYSIQKPMDSMDSMDGQIITV